MPAPVKKAILSRLPGFFFGPGAVFPEEVSEQVYRALLGDFQGMSRIEAVGRARDAATELFKAALGQAFLYKALRGGVIAWEMIANSAVLHAELDAQQAQIAVETLISARRAFAGKKVEALATLVDQFAQVVDETVELGPAQTLSLAVHSSNPAGSTTSPTASIESTAIINSLAAAMDELHIRHPWPPAYFNQRELLILAQIPITRALAGVDPDHRDLITNVAAPTPSSRGTPLALQIALCRQALTQYRPTTDWSLLLSPVGFIDHATGAAWFDVLGPQHRKPFATLPVFLTAAAEAFTNGGKSFFLGLLTHWHHLPATILSAAATAGAKPSDTWLNGLRTQRFASVMILRRVAMGDGQGEDRIQVVWYDPWLHAAEIKQQAKPHAMSVFSYRRAVAEGVRKLARDAGMKIHSRYWGGYGATRPDIAGDSVMLSLAFLERLVSGEKMAGVFPDPEDEEGFGRMGFVRSQDI